MTANSLFFEETDSLEKWENVFQEVFTKNRKNKYQLVTLINNYRF